MKMIIVSMVVGAAAVAAPALAQAPGGGSGQRDQTRAQVQQRADMIFQMIDSNHDGVVTRQEAEQAATQFAARSEGEGRGGGRMQRMIEQAFGSAQSITLQQFEAKFVARFDAMDLNRDGVVTAAEREQFRAQRSAGAAGTQTPVATPVPAAPPPPGQ